VQRCGTGKKGCYRRKVGYVNLKPRSDRVAQALQPTLPLSENGDSDRHPDCHVSSSSLIPSPISIHGTQSLSYPLIVVPPPTCTSVDVGRTTRNLPGGTLQHVNVAFRFANTGARWHCSSCVLLISPRSQPPTFRAARHPERSRQSANGPNTTTGSTPSISPYLSVPSPISSSQRVVELFYGILTAPALRRTHQEANSTA
jgi:hypothetical protein